MRRKTEAKFEMIAEADRDPGLRQWEQERADASSEALEDFLTEMELEELAEQSVLEEFDASFQEDGAATISSAFFKRHPALANEAADQRFIFKNLPPEDRRSPEFLLMSAEETRLTAGVGAALALVKEALSAYPDNELLRGRLAELHEQLDHRAERNEILRELVGRQQWSMEGRVVVNGYALRAKRLEPRFAQWMTIEGLLRNEDDYAGLVVSQASAFEALVRMTLVEEVPRGVRQSVLAHAEPETTQKQLAALLSAPKKRLSLGPLAFWLDALRRGIARRDSAIGAWLLDAMALEIPGLVVGPPIAVAEMFASVELAQFIRKCAEKWRNPLVHEDLNTAISHDRYRHWCLQMFGAESVREWWDVGCSQAHPRLGWMARLLVAAWLPAWAWRRFPAHELQGIVDAAVAPMLCRNSPFPEFAPPVDDSLPF